MQSLTNLNDKISAMMEKYALLKSENESLKAEVVLFQKEIKDKSVEIDKLLEQNAFKDLEIEEIIEKIEKLMA